MTDRRGYYPTNDLDRTQWSSNTQRYPAPSSHTYQTVPANYASPPTHIYPSTQYGVNDYTGPFPSNQCLVPTSNVYHQPRQTYPPPNHPHQAPSSSVPHYAVPSQQYAAPHQQPGIHHQTYYGRDSSQYQQPQYPASPARPFSCDLCALSFNRQHDLKRHRETHSGEKPFLCNGGCGKTFTRKDALKRHQLVKHCGQEEEVS